MLLLFLERLTGLEPITGHEVSFCRGTGRSRNILGGYVMEVKAFGEYVSRASGGAKIIVVSNREPVVHERIDGDGVLILSQYTGAARELADALQVNPFDLDQLAELMYEAFRMGEAERRQRMERMRAQVERNTVFEWGLRIFEELERIIPLRTKLDGGGSDDHATLDLRFRRNPFATCA